MSEDNNAVIIEAEDNRVIYTLFTKSPKIVIDGVPIKNLISYYVKVGDTDSLDPERAIISVTFSTNDLELVRSKR